MYFHIIFIIVYCIDMFCTILYVDISICLFCFILLCYALLRLNKTGGLDWWFGVGGKALFFDIFLIFFKLLIEHFTILNYLPITTTFFKHNF